MLWLMVNLKSAGLGEGIHQVLLNAEHDSCIINEQQLSDKSYTDFVLCFRMGEVEKLTILSGIGVIQVVLQCFIGSGCILYLTGIFPAAKLFMVLLL